MADVNPLKLVDLGDGQGQLREMQAGDKIPGDLLPATEWSADTVSQAEAEAGTATIRRAWTAERVRQAILGWWTGATSAFGRGFVAAADAAAGRTALGLGTAATRAALGSTGSLYSRDSVLGAVSQSAGIPTGAVIERGSNANGYYERYASGLQICIVPSGFQVAFANTLYMQAEWTYPAGFMAGTATPYLTTGAAVAVNNKFNRAVPQGQAHSVGSATLRLFATGTDSFVSGETHPAYGFAIGRWY